MAGKLPNELIREILYPSFHVPDEMLRDVSDISPFFRPSYQPCSSLLLVCKRWMLVGTPLLYQVVILRSKAQAYALERTLRRSADLGTLVKKLRVEGGYGIAMRTVIISSPNIQELGISLDLRSSDSVKGLLGSLSHINPTSLVVLDPVYKEGKVNAPLRTLSEKVMTCFTTWSNLNHIYLPQTYYRFPFSKILDALSGVVNLQTVNIPGRTAMSCIGALETLAKHQSLKNINLTFPEDEFFFSETIVEMDKLRVRSSLRGLVTFSVPFDPVKDQIYIAHPSSPPYTPLANVSRDLYDIIWGRIIHFAMHVDPYPHEYSRKDSKFYMLCKTYQHIAVVSKAFRRLSLPYKYRYALFGDASAIKRHTASLKLDLPQGSQLRSIIFWPNLWAFGAGAFVPNCMDIILSLAFNLESVSPAYLIQPGRKEHRHDGYLSISWTGFRVLSGLSGPKMLYLLDVIILATPSIESPSVLSRFSALREFACTFNTVLDTEAPVSPDWLPCLEVLKLRSCHSSFLDVLSKLNLPALRELEVVSFHKEIPQVTNFLEKHGRKVLVLMLEHHALPVFDLCPNVTQLTLVAPRYRQSATFGMPIIIKKHNHISKISFLPEHDDIFSDIFPSPELDLITGINYSFFPNLNEIQVFSIQWPATEYDISKSVWPRYSDTLATHGIKLTDHKGISWRPRLKYSRT